MRTIAVDRTPKHTAINWAIERVKHCGRRLKNRHTKRNEKKEVETNSEREKNENEMSAKWKSVNSGEILIKANRISN